MRILEKQGGRLDRRIELLEEIIHNPRPLGSALQELAEFEHQVKCYLVKVRRNCFIDVLRQDELAKQQATIGMSATAVTEWARWLSNQWM